MAKNPLKDGSAPHGMTAATAEKFARWARENGDGEMARLWHERAAELAKAERGVPSATD